MFSRIEYTCFFVSFLFVSAGFALVAWDPVDNGFGIATRWIAPPLLLVGFVLPIFGISGVKYLQKVRRPEFGMRHVAGYLAFLVALTVYMLTLEPTASLWDCSEFIASAYKLQVPHTPGTPLALLIGRVFTMFAPQVTSVAVSLNFMSAFFSAMTVYVLYHLILHFGGALLKQRHRSDKILAIAAWGGALTLAFSDTFWFSAVEAETYGTASFFMLLLVLLIVKGCGMKGAERSRRLVLIFYLAGLGYCIHPMCLLALTILPFAWASGDSSLTLSRTVVGVAAGLAIVFVINRFVAIGIFELAFSFDLFAVNRLGMPFYSGAVSLIVLVVLLCRYLCRYAVAQRYVLSFVFLVLGFLPYLLLFIRSGHNPPIDETNPENLPLIKAYMNRESYPTAPLLYGPYYDAGIVDISVKKEIYYKSDKDYRVAGTLPQYHYDTRQTILPRIYSHDSNHVKAYRTWLGLQENEPPGFAENLRFMFTYQLGHMYFRYLLWNFAGRESDEQNSDWLRPWQGLTALPFERARNQYWMIPLLLGIAGSIFHYMRDRRAFTAVLTLFLVTGAVLALYLNSPPAEPRERDYIYVGSFIAFSAWVGIGLLAVAILAGKVGRATFILLAAGIPLWMLIQNYDDHNRSGRTLQVDNARNVLLSCAPNAILFTGGDNDTFPLWYLQEVEGFRTDVRVMVLSYMNTDWYINQLRKSYYDSPAFKLTLEEDDYRQYGLNDVLYLRETIKDTIDFRQFLALLKQQHPALRMVSNHGEPYHILPSRNLRIGGEHLDTGSDEMIVHIQGNYMSKNLLAILDLAVSNGFERPIYFNIGSLSTLDADLSRYVVQEGSVFRLTPRLNTGDQMVVNTRLSYENIIIKADYHNLRDASVHFSYEDHFARIIGPQRQSFNDLAAAFLREGNREMAKKVITHAFENLYFDHLRPSYTNLEAAEIMLELGLRDYARKLVQDLFTYYAAREVFGRKHNRILSQLDHYLLRRAQELLQTIE